MGAVQLTEAEWLQQVWTFDHTCFRFECQPLYSEPGEASTFGRFLAGDPEPPTAAAELRDWFDQVAGHVAAGRRIERVRIHDVPPTRYQEWVRWIGRWNIAAGETIRYMTRAQARTAGLGAALGSVDWWLIDSGRLIEMLFDEAGQRIEQRLVTDPAKVTQACEWWDLAVHHSAPDPG